eukprot:CAMPEP_0172740066 /NCGR_PEP_ID=MMETSP1074-20121228/124026_1 /TAXON_ID=2916 /ORGANISM="Ceratium fusus, Strain PA161109" /LENGTH=231 /DNA_ID=CAMNT_0013570095 /DNA_START=24 /DNA_END=719 /DNA_ORIENTATION=+
MASLPILISLCWVLSRFLTRVAADALILVFSEVSGCLSDPHLNYTLVAGTGLLHGQWLDKVERVRTHALEEQLSAPGSMLVQCVGDADWMISWCPLLDGACRTALEEPMQFLPRSAESYRISSKEIQKFRGGHCIKAVGLHGQQQTNLQLRSPSDLRLPQYGACRAVPRALEAVAAVAGETLATQGPGNTFGAALLITAISIFVALIGGIAFLNRIKEWGDPCPPANPAER